MTGRAILTAICEIPGWSPPQPVSSTDERALAELQRDGWIIPRLDGWEATPRALTEYPDFQGYEGLMGDVAPRLTPTAALDVIEPEVGEWVDQSRGRLFLTGEQTARTDFVFGAGGVGQGRGHVELAWLSLRHGEVTQVEVVIRTRTINFPSSDQPEVGETPE